MRGDGLERLIQESASLTDVYLKVSRVVTRPSNLLLTRELSSRR